MTRTIWPAAAAVAAFLSSGGSGREPMAPARIEVGARFPELFLPSLEDGCPLSLKAFRGPKVILHVFASW